MAFSPGPYTVPLELTIYSRTSLVGTPGDHIICIEKALKGTEIVVVLTVFLLTQGRSHQLKVVRLDRAGYSTNRTK